MKNLIDIYKDILNEDALDEDYLAKMNEDDPDADFFTANGFEKSESGNSWYKEIMADNEHLVTIGIYWNGEEEEDDYGNYVAVFKLDGRPLVNYANRTIESTLKGLLDEIRKLVTYLENSFKNTCVAIDNMFSKSEES